VSHLQERDKETLAFRTEVAFLGKDHVGSVRHFEGYDLNKFAESSRKIIARLGLKSKDSIESLSGKAIYTIVSQIDDNMFLWVKGLEVKGVGVVADVKVIHGTEDSAKADELLSNFFELMDAEMGLA
jgi:hypothetical protein